MGLGRSRSLSHRLVGGLMVVLVAFASLSAPASAAAPQAQSSPTSAWHKTGAGQQHVQANERAVPSESPKPRFAFLTALINSLLAFKTAVGAVMLHLWKVGHPGKSNTCN